MFRSQHPAMRLGANVRSIASCKFVVGWLAFAACVAGLAPGATGEDCSLKETARAAVLCLQSKIDGNARDRVVVLAALRVQDGRVVTSSEGVIFEPQTGIITFKNPGNLQFVPVVSNFVTNAYITENHFVREVITTNKFKVWRSTQDTSGRNGAPTSFTVIVVGF